MLKTAYKVFVAGLGWVAVTAHAAVPVAVSTAITDMSADAATVAGAVLVGIIGIAAIKFIRKGL
ncbi:MAG: major capsid protein [Gallionellaceae bacterium]|jgi:hypothetical protein